MKHEIEVSITKWGWTRIISTKLSCPPAVGNPVQASWDKGFMFVFQFQINLFRKCEFL